MSHSISRCPMFALLVVLSLAAIAGAADGPAPLRIHMLSGSTEYQSEASLKTFATHLEKRFHLTITASWGKDKGDTLPDLEKLKDADLMIVFTRRMKLPEEQLALIRKHYEGGKPVIGLRTAGHAFDDATNANFDAQVLGGQYKGHGGNDPVTITTTAAAKDHPILKGAGEFTSRKLYSQGTMASGAVVLQQGEDQKSKTISAVTWVHEHKGGRIFYTSLAVPEAFENEHFLSMLTNAVFWTTKRNETDYAKTDNAGEKPWKLLFNGKDLTGWKPIGNAVWKADNNILVGGQDGDPKRSGLLTSTESFQDFELSFDFMIDEHGKYNSGVYLRNDPDTGKRTGYQINIGRGAAGEYCGGLHLADWLAKGDEKDEIRKPKEWNSMRIIAKGAHIRVDLNGKNVVDFTDSKPEAKLLQKGVIGFQTYGAEGHAGWVKFRDVKVRELE